MIVISACKDETDSTRLADTAQVLNVEAPPAPRKASSATPSSIQDSASHARPPTAEDTRESYLQWIRSSLSVLSTSSLSTSSLSLSSLNVERLVASVPGVSTESADGEEKTSPLRTSSLDPDSVLDRLDGTRVLLLIHGYNTPFDVAAEAFGRIADRIQTEASPYDHVLGFAWPGGASPYSYPWVKRRLGPTSRVLRWWLMRLGRACDAVDVLAHSLGNRLLRTAMSSSRSPSLRTLFAVAPALPRRIVREDRSATARLRRFERVFLFYTRSDDVLRRYFPLVEWDRALGETGLETIADVTPPVPVTAVNCEGVVTSHAEYLEQDAFYAFLHRVHEDARVVASRKNGLASIRLSDVVSTAPPEAVRDASPPPPRARA